MESDEHFTKDPSIPSRIEASQHLAELDAAESRLFTSRDCPSWYAPYTGLCYGVLAAALDSSLNELLMVAIAIAASTMHAAVIAPQLRRQGVAPRLRDAPREVKGQLALFGIACVVAFGLVIAVGAVAPWWLTGVTAFVAAAAVYQMQVHRLTSIAVRLSVTAPTANAS